MVPFCLFVRFLFLRPADLLHSVLGQGLGNRAGKLRQGTVGFSCSFFFRPADALLSSEPGGGQSNLSTHTVPQDYMFCLLFFVMHVILFSLCYAFSARHFPPPLGSVGCAAFPLRVWFSLFLSRPPATMVACGRVFDVRFPCLSACVLLQFAFLRLAPPPR